jgi:pentatricopeptide repeat protein
LKVRIIKHSSKFQEFAKVVKATFGLDLEMPCAPPGLASEGNIRPLDKHSHNSILSALAKRQQFSKMVSVFESLAYPHLSGPTYPVQTADQNSFFSLSFDWFNWRTPAKSAAIEDPATAEPASEPQHEQTAETRIAEGDGDSISDPIAIETRSNIKITALNTRTFELMIETALAGSSHGVARHYMLEMLEAWEQERQRLRSAYASLAAYRVPFVTARIRAQGLLRTGRDKYSVVLQDPERPSWDQIWQPGTLGPAIGPSAHSIYRIYHKLAGEWTSHLHWLKPLQELVKDVDRVLEYVRDDIQFWTNIHDKQRFLAEVYKTLPPYERALHAAGPRFDYRADAAGKEEDSFTGYQNLPFDTQLHLLILRKIEAELNDIHHEMHHRHTHTAAGRYIRGMLNELRGERKTSRISRLVNAMRRSERWCYMDEIADEQRAEAIMELHTLSYAQKKNQVKNMRRIAEGRRQAVRRAILRARGTLADLQRPTEPAAAPLVKAIPTRGLASQLRSARVAASSAQGADSVRAQTAQDTRRIEQPDHIKRSALQPKRRYTRVQLGEIDNERQSSPTITSGGAASAVSDASR